MKLNPIKSNMTEVELTDGTSVLFSYKTPVAACMGDGTGFFRTSKKWSKTTSSHINQWLAGAKANEKPQEFFDALA